MFLPHSHPFSHVQTLLAETCILPPAGWDEVQPLFLVVAVVGAVDVFLLFMHVYGALSPPAGVTIPMSVIGPVVELCFNCTRRPSANLLPVRGGAERRKR